MAFTEGPASVIVIAPPAGPNAMGWSANLDDAPTGQTRIMGTLSWSEILVGCDWPSTERTNLLRAPTG